MALVILAGLLDIGFAIFHLLFWRLFAWPESLLRTGIVNQAVTQTLNWVLIYVFLVYGASLVWLASIQHGAPSPLLAAGTGFWLFRTALQPLLFPMRNWRSLVVSAAFVVTTAFHAAPLIWA